MDHLNRRTFLGLTAGVAGAAALAACGSGDGNKNAATGDNANVKLPDAVAPKSLPGQVDSKVTGVPTAYTQYPSNPVKSVTTPPGSGSEITTMQINFDPPPPSPNRWLDTLNKELNVTLKPTLVADADLAQKTQTFIASGDIPDIFFLHTKKVPAAVKFVQQGAFLELSKYIGGDKSKDFPNLAAIPQISWKNSAIGGGLYGVPRAVPAANSGQPLFRADWLQKLGGKAPTSADEVAEMLKAFSTGGKYAFGGMVPWDVECILSMFNVPNNWKQGSDGKLVKDIETDEFAAAVEYLNKLYKANVFHPNAVGNGWSENQELWISGTTGFFGGNILASMTYLRGTPIKGVDDIVASVKPFVAPGKDSGGKPGFFEGSASFGVFAIPAKLEKDEKKVREILGVLNYMAAPFGTVEYALINYGVLNSNYTMVNGIPTPSEDKAKQAELAPHYVPTPGEASIYIPGPPSQSEQVQKYFEQVQPNLVKDPTMTKISQAYISKGTSLDKMVEDQFKNFVSGRRPLTELDDFRKTWKSQGGDDVRREFQDAG